MADKAEDANRPRIGLALSGGGARGAAHIGVLQVLEEYRIPVDYIAGTSMGSIVGGLYAAGMTSAQLEEVISRVDWDEAFTDRIPREERSFRRKRDDDLYLIKNRPGISADGLKLPSGLIDGQDIDLLFKRYTIPVVTVRDFDSLAVPFRAVAADIETGRAEVIGGGDLALAMRASMSIPIVFAPRTVGSRLMVDGGISMNLPVEVVRDMGADIVIAVDISSPLKDREELNSILSITNQLTTIMTRRNTEEQIASLITRRAEFHGHARG
ncbi:MAG: patatin-like phospholipase family protein [Candidatus Krumholzibacteriales bacterium]